MVLTVLLLLVRQIDSSYRQDSVLDKSSAQFRIPMIQSSTATNSNSALNKSVQSSPIFDSEKNISGKITVVNFWASWCEVCNSERVYLESLYFEFGNRVQFLGIASNDTLEAIRKSGKAQGISYSILLDEEGEVGKLFRVSALPNTFLIDTSGNIVKIVLGALNPKSKEELSGLIRSLL